MHAIKPQKYIIFDNISTWLIKTLLSCIAKKIIMGLGYSTIQQPAPTFHKRFGISRDKGCNFLKIML